jgi:hypothetical protein
VNIKSFSSPPNTPRRPAFPEPEKGHVKLAAVYATAGLIGARISEE